MKYKLFNNANTDLHIPVKHGVKKAGVMGSTGSLPRKLVIPGLAKVEDGKNHLIISEEDLRSIFGLFDWARPGVIDRDKPMKISPDNVKYNTRLLDTGRIIVTDEFGNHVFGIGGTAYQKAATDTLKDRVSMLEDERETWIKVLVDQMGMTEDDAKAIVKNKKDNAKEILQKYNIGKSMSVKSEAPKSEIEVTPLDAAKLAFKDAETLNVFVGEESAGEYKVKSISNAIKKITKLAAEAETPLSYDDAGLPWFQDSEKRIVRLA